MSLALIIRFGDPLDRVKATRTRFTYNITSRKELRYILLTLNTAQFAPSTP
jgi:hypothetical protein